MFPENEGPIDRVICIVGGFVSDLLYTSSP